MSKSLGNHIPINTTAEDMFGKVMSLPDTAMAVYARLATRWLPEKVADFTAGLADARVHPRDAKMELGLEITETFHGEEGAKQAKQAFINVFQKGGTPDPNDMKVYILAENETVLDLLTANDMVKSRSEGRRMI